MSEHAEQIVYTFRNGVEVPANGGAPDMKTTALQEAIRKVVLDKDIAPFDKRRVIRDLIEQELLDPRRGFLCRTSDGRGFYFHKGERRLFDLEQRPFQHLLSSVSGLSATEMQFRFVLDAFQTHAGRTQPVEVHVLSHYDPKTGALAVSDGGGGVWRREMCGDWECGHNGDNGILFATDFDAVPFQPDFKSSGGLAWFVNRFPFDESQVLSPEEQRLAFTVWAFQNYFPSLRRTRVIPAFLGPQGSGKTSAMRAFGTLLCGKDFDVTGLSRDREDAFIAAISNRTVVAVDNADSRVPWLEDSLATYATGLRYRLRRLYSTNEEASFEPRAILMISSRDPHFRRPDVAERLLPFYFRRPETFIPESRFFDELLERRDEVLGDLMNRIGSVADCLAGQSLPSLRFRMADFASFGWCVAASGGEEAEWLKLLGKLERSQVAFASEGDSLVAVIRTILEADGAIGPIDTGALYKRCVAVAESESLPIARTAAGFGKHFMNMRRVIEVELQAKVSEERLGWRRYITIQPKGSPTGGASGASGDKS